MYDFRGTWHKLSDDLDWMGDSMSALRTYQAVHAVEMLAEWPDLARDDVRFHGGGFIRRIACHFSLLSAPPCLRVRGCHSAR